MTDLDHEAIQQTRGRIGPDHRLLTDDDIRRLALYQQTRLGLAISRPLTEWVNQMKERIAEAHRLLTAAGLIDPTPPEDQ